MLVASVAHSATYYIDYNASNDSANGTTKSTPWKRAPWMTGFSGSYSHAAGDHFIFKGGVTWPGSVFPSGTDGVDTLPSGTSGSRDYYGVDATWYNGGSWTRPIWDLGGSSIPRHTLFWMNDVDYVTFEGIEITNFYFNSSTDGFGTALFFLYEANAIWWINCYFHNWSHGTGGGDDLQVILTYPGHDSVIDSCIFDGSPNGTDSGMATYSYQGTITNSISRNMSNGFLMSGGGTLSYCTIGPINDSFDSAQHENEMETTGGGTYYVYNNVFFSPTAVCILNGNAETDYVWNNLFYQMNGVIPFQCDGRAGQSTGYFYNNTAVVDGGIFIRNTGLGTPWNNTIVNNHVINGTLTDGSATSSNNLIQTTSQATADGYTSGNNWQPTTSASSTVNAGASQSGLFTNDLLNVARPQGASWDIGAYEFVGTDTAAPTLQTAVIDSTGSVLTLNFSEIVATGSADNAGWSMSASGGALTASYSSGDGSISVAYSLSRTVQLGETVTVSYTQPGNGVEDIAGNDLATTGSVSVTNNSTAGQVVLPVFSPVAGPYFNTTNVSITSSTTGSTIYYTNDGSTPTISSTVYSSPISVSVNATLKALAVKSGLVNSSIATAAYEVTTWASDGNWKTFVIPSQAANFAWTFRFTPSTSTSDSVIGLSPVNVDQYTDMAPIIRFSTSSVIEAMNATAYSAVNTVTYSAGTAYTFSVSVDMTNNTYSVTVTPQGGSPSVIATNYQFRSTQPDPSELDNIGIITSDGTGTLDQMTVGSGTVNCNALNVTTLRIGQ